MCINISNEQIEQEHVLGLYLGDKLKWDSLIKFSKKWVTSGIYALKMAMRVLSSYLLLCTFIRKLALVFL